MKSILYPYPTVNKAHPTLRVTQLLVDGTPRVALIDDQEGKIVLHEEGKWERAELGMELACNAGAIEAFEAEHGTVGVTVTANCAPTNHRHGVQLDRKSSSLWVGRLEVDRDNASERTYVEATLTATVHGLPHRPVAASPCWTLYADPPRSLLFQGTLRVSWIDFRSDEAPQLARDFKDSTHVVDLDGGTPRLLLNSGFDGLVPLLDDRKGRGGVDRALHDFQRAGIARATWLTLITEALADVQGQPDGTTDELGWPKTEWKAEVLKHILPLVDPSLTERELLEQAAGAWRGEGAGQFLARAEAVVGELIGANTFVRRCVQTYAREADK